MIEKAVLLAAGRGTRMGAITLEIPKPMLPARGKPMMEHIMDGLAEAGIRRFLIVVGYQGEFITKHFSEWQFPVEFRGARSGEWDGRGGIADARICGW